MTMTKITLTADQQNANDEFLDFLVDDNAKYMVLQGAAGSGKSFLLQHLLDNFQNEYKTYNLLLQRDPQHEFEMQLSATTNKAVKVVRDFTGDIGAKTLHSFLNLKVVNNFQTGKTDLEKTDSWKYHFNKLIIIDEASFIDNDLFQFLEDSTSKDCKILFVGDQYQLAPIGQTESVMETMKCTKVFMNKIMRNSGTILQTSAMFRDTVMTGVFQPIQYTDNKVIHVSGADFKQRVNDHFTDPDYHPDKAKILAWTNDKVQAYNSHIRDVLSLPALFSEGEIVITNKPLMKGATAYPVDSEVRITDIEKKHETKYGVQGRWVTVNGKHTAFLANDFNDVKIVLKKLARKKNWRTFFEIKDTWLDLRSVYASTVHKAQGSTYENVFIDLTDIGKNFIASDVARLLYVAFSRASKQVICRGTLPYKYTGV